MRFIDGLSKRIKEPPKKHRLRWGWAVFGVGLSLILVLFLSIQPLFAALPLTNWQDNAALTRLLRPGTYLILFQNNRELRPTGGFIGSFATVKLGWGLKVEAMHVETNIYTRDKLYAPTLHATAPAPIGEFLGKETPWSMRDSNWALDYPEAAEMIAWFYQQEGGEPVDAVIATDTRLIERLLRLTGPITLPGYDTTLSANNVVETLQDQVEKQYWEDPTHKIDNEPKQIIGDLLPVLKDRVLAVSKYSLAAELAQSFQAKEVMVAARNPDLAKFFLAANWDGHVSHATPDELYINESNMSAFPPRIPPIGSKSSWSIRRQVTLSRIPDTQGVLHTLTLDRAHQGKALAPDGPNNSFLRIAVPKGSTLVSITKNGVNMAGDVQLSQEAGLTVFGFWHQLEPGWRDSLEVAYITPTSWGDKLTIQRQPGAPDYPVTVIDQGKEQWSGLLHEDRQI